MAEPRDGATALRDPQGAEEAYLRIKPELDTLDPRRLSPLNVDVVTATSTVLGVAPRLTTFRAEMAALPRFEIRCLDRLVDYAQAAWFLFVTHPPPPGAPDADALLREAQALRTKLLRWARPLAHDSLLDARALGLILKGKGNKDTASDLVSLVALYRSRWAEVARLCNITEEELQRATALGSQAFALLSRRESPPLPAITVGSLPVRRAWTLLDRAYDQCRRAITYLRHDEGDADEIAPSLRRNPGPRAKRRSPGDPGSTPAG